MRPPAPSTPHPRMLIGTLNNNSTLTLTLNNPKPPQVQRHAAQRLGRALCVHKPLRDAPQRQPAVGAAAGVGQAGGVPGAEQALPGGELLHGWV